MLPLPEGFKEMLHGLLGDEASQLIKALDEPSCVAIRLNRRKPIHEFQDTAPVAWCQSGLYLPQRPEFIKDPLLHAGAYYVQDPSSMIYETVISRILENGELSSVKPLRVLDLCAAPGGKTTAIINALPEGSEVTANEYSRKRVEALRENIERWGYPLVTVANRDSSFYAGQGERYHITAVDAPCSGEGMMRKEEMARTQWSPELIDQCATLQREILDNAVKTILPGGYLIYSTCTFNRKENEENARYIAENLGLTPVDLKFPEEWGIPKGLDTEVPAYRFMPHKTKGEGLFLAVFKKNGTPDFKDSSSRSRPVKKSPGVSKASDAQEKPLVDVDKPTALKYLHGEAIILSEDAPRGVVTVCYRGLPLGEAKNIGTRANNLLPKSRRIRKQV